MDEEALTFRLDADTSQLQRSLRDADALGQRFGRTMTAAFADVAVRGRKLDDVIKGIGLRLSEMALKAAFKPIEQSFASGFGQLFSGVTGFSNGGVPGRSIATPFAAGGVVAAPTAFSFGSDQLGVMGEAGAEAILPLARGADGKLGVRTGGGVNGRAVNVTFNVNSGDAESFQRSEAQIGAMLSRVIARGERNL
ncbi:MAG: phage tail tape measure protein [Pseudomonadota bacterium]